MLRHVLIVIDGSGYALKTARYGIRLARSLDAMATAAIVSRPLRSLVPSEVAQGHLQSEYGSHIEMWAERCLAKVRAISMENGFVCETLHICGESPTETLLALAAEQRCDALLIGSQHGRGTAVAAGRSSDVDDLLEQSRIPVIVYRE